MEEKPYQSIIKFLNYPIGSISNEEVIDGLNRFLREMEVESWNMQLLLYNIRNDEDRIKCGLGIIEELLEYYWRYFARIKSWVIHAGEDAYLASEFHLQIRACQTFERAIKSVLRVIYINLGLSFSEYEIKFYEEWYKKETSDFPQNDHYLVNIEFFPLDVAEEMKQYNKMKDSVDTANHLLCESKGKKDVSKNLKVKGNSNKSSYLRFPLADKFDVNRAFDILIKRGLIHSDTPKEHFLYWFGVEMEKPTDLRPIEWITIRNVPNVLLSYFVDRYCLMVHERICQWEMIKKVFHINGEVPNTKSMKTYFNRVKGKCKHMDWIDSIFDD